MTSTDTNTITIICLVNGESSGHAFALDIGKDKHISHLKKQIKKEKAPKFDNLAADELVLWKVDIPTSDLDTMPEDLVLENNKEKGVQALHPVNKIGNIFSGVPEESIHVIVE